MGKRTAKQEQSPTAAHERSHGRKPVVARRAEDRTAPEGAREPDRSNEKFPQPGLREGQACAASILCSVFGALAEQNPELWGHRAYLLLMGIVYQRLAANEESISLEELVSLAKVLAEQRRIAARAGQGEVADPPDLPASLRTQLPGEFADVVKQIYGTNFYQQKREHPESPSRRDENNAETHSPTSPGPLCVPENRQRSSETQAAPQTLV